MQSAEKICLPASIEAELAAIRPDDLTPRDAIDFSIG